MDEQLIPQVAKFVWGQIWFDFVLCFALGFIGGLLVGAFLSRRKE